MLQRRPANRLQRHLLNLQVRVGIESQGLGFGNEDLAVLWRDGIGVEGCWGWIAESTI